MQQNFPFESEPIETEKSSSHWSSVAEKLERYGSHALNSTEHLGLLVGNQTIAIELLQHFGSIRNLSRATVAELTPYLPKATAQTLIAALSVSSRATVEEAENEKMDNPETVFRSCLDMQVFHQEVLRAILLDTRFRRLNTVDISTGTLNESLAHPREIFRPKNVARMSQRLVNSSLGDFNGRAMAVARVQQKDAQNLLAEKLHIFAGSID